MIGALRNKINLYLVKLVHSQFSVGVNSTITRETRFWIGQNRLSIGEGVYINSRQKGYHAAMPFPTTFLIDVKGAFIEIGDSANLNGVFVHAQKGVTIGKNTVIASGVSILDSNGHEVHSSNRTVLRDIPKPIIIGENVWIGINVVILKGTTIGNNSVVSAGSVVKGDFPENSIIAGNPAVVTGKVKIANA
jgi:acetyltransferase-like isoleucine patch superfamily enzyme